MSLKIAIAVASVAITASSHAALSLKQHWAMDEGAGSSTFNSVSSVHGTVHGATWSTDTPAGLGGRSLYFDGVNDYVQMHTDVVYSWQADWVVTFWYKGTDTRSPGWDGGPGGNRLLVGDSRSAWAEIYMVGGKLEYGFHNGGWRRVQSNQNIADGQWHHIAVVNDYTPGGTSNASLYIDGQLYVTGNSQMDGGAGNSGKYVIYQFMQNYTPQGNYTQGYLDDVRLYEFSGSVSGGEIAAMVPEPASMVGAAALGAMALCRRRSARV